MALTRNQKTELDNLLNKGDLVGASKILNSAAGLTQPEEPAPAEPAPPPEPRNPAEVVLDLFKGVHQLLGNSPALVPLIAELDELVNQAPAATEPPSK